MTVYEVVVTREDGNWLADVTGLAGAHTFAGSLPGLRRSVREVIVLMDDLPDDAEPDVTFTFDGTDDAVRTAVAVARRREELAAAEADLGTATLGAIRALQAEGHSVRDVAALVGVTPGRISQLAPRGRRSTERLATTPQG